MSPLIQASPGLDDLARQRAEAVAEAIRKRAVREVRAEHTKEVVRTDLPDDLKAAFVEAVTTVATLTLRVGQLEARVADLESLLAGLAREARAA